MAFLTIEQLACQRQGKQIIPHIDFMVEQGEFACLLGPSGCGKTTLLRLIAGLEQVNGGTITLNDVPLSDATTHVPPDKRQIGMVFQHPALFPAHTVEKNVGFGLRRNHPQRQARIVHLLEHIGLSDRADAYPHQLSGGEQQRVALARALATAPQLLLLDEPFAHLDPARRQRLRHETKQLARREGVTCLMVTHDAAEAMMMADRIILMDAAGHIRQQGSAHDVYHHPVDRYAAQALGEVNLLPAKAENGVVTTSLGTFETRLGKQGALLFAIRPEDVLVQRGENRSGAEPVAVVREVTTTGPEDLLSLTLGDGTSLQARLPHAHHWREMDQVALTVRPDSWHLFDSKA